MKKFKILTALVLIMVMILGMNLEASAVTDPINTIVERRADLPNIFASDTSTDDCTGIQAMGVSRRENCLYSLKIRNNDEAVLYYFPNISDWETKAAFSIYDVGHANGMTVDTEYIYICASPNGNYDNTIVRIDRDYIERRADIIATNANITVATETLSESLGEDTYKIMQPKVVNTSSDGATTYTNYTGGFSTITRAESTGKFIIGTEVSGVDKYEYNGFTRAEIIDGEFVVSNNPDDIFLVKNNIVHKYAARQDIHYLQGYGLFIGRWYGGGSDSPTSQYCNEANNVILWADIDKITNTTHMGYKYYTPDKIKIYMEDYKVNNITVYEKFEIESMGITAKGNLIATFNVTYTSTYYNEYISGNNNNIPSRGNADGIYKITRADGGTFKLS